MSDAETNPADRQNEALSVDSAHSDIPVAINQSSENATVIINQPCQSSIQEPVQLAETPFSGVGATENVAESPAPMNMMINQCQMGLGHLAPRR